jgi:hypothetical protein
LVFFPDHAGAGNEIRTRDLNLGKVALYQLSYSRIFFRLQPKANTSVKPATIAWAAVVLNRRSPQDANVK